VQFGASAASSDSQILKQNANFNIGKFMCLAKFESVLTRENTFARNKNQNYRKNDALWVTDTPVKCHLLQYGGSVGYDRAENVIFFFKKRESARKRYTHMRSPPSGCR